MKLVLQLSLQALLLAAAVGTRPAPAKYFHQQSVDHVNSDGAYADMEWSQRYYTWDIEFKGAGSPIFIIMGGEGHIPPSVGLHYPFVTDHLAKAFGAYVIQPEHRFYGESQPLESHDGVWAEAPEDPRVELLTPEQAVLDAIKLLDHIREELNCSDDRFSETYCPVITVGGSYPGFLAAFSRIMVPHKVDMAYAASAPMKFYSQEVNADDYYGHISLVMELVSMGCSDDISNALTQLQWHAYDGNIVPEDVGVCPDTVPDYITTKGLFSDELIMVIAYTFANDNMAHYPPASNTRLRRACDTFMNPHLSIAEQVKQFLLERLTIDKNDTCWDMTQQLPAGPRATISSGDWSGVGTGVDGESWDFQTCGILIEAIGFSERSMFPKRDWSLDWLADHCQSRFGVTPDPFRFVDEWHFDKLVENNVTRVLFTNGINDGWSVGGITEKLSNDLPVINFLNGAHHSDLSGKGPSDEDTDDIKVGFVQIQSILASWLLEVKNEAVEPQKSVS